MNVTRGEASKMIGSWLVEDKTIINDEYVIRGTPPSDTPPDMEMEWVAVRILTDKYNVTLSAADEKAIEKEIEENSPLLPMTVVIHLRETLRHYYNSITSIDEARAFYNEELFLIKLIWIGSGSMPNIEKRTLAEAAHKEALAGADFDELMDEYNLEPIKGSVTSLMSNYTDRLISSADIPIAETAKTMKDGEISDIVETTLGYHIINRCSVIPEEFENNYSSVLYEMYEKLIRTQINAFEIK